MRSESWISSAEKVFDVIENESARLEEVEGVGKKRRQEIRESWTKQKAVHDIMVFLHERGISTARALRIYKTYGDEAVEVLKKNPYRLAADIHGVGFKTADEIAANMGIAQGGAPACARRTALFAWMRRPGRGTRCVPRPALIEEAGKILDASSEVVESQLDAMLADDSLIVETIAGEQRVFLPPLCHAEKNIAVRLRETAGQACRLSGDGHRQGDCLGGAEDRARSSAESQQRAVREALQQRVLIITGGPGVGKTTIVNTILTILRAKKVRVVLAAPTGRAAQRLSESTGLEAKTLHRLLEYPGRRRMGPQPEQAAHG